MDTTKQHNTTQTTPLWYRMYTNKWVPRLFYMKSDGGVNSGVTGYFLIEWKVAFSIGILHFKPGSREAFHSHAFNALTWWLFGSVDENRVRQLSHDKSSVTLITTRTFGPSWKPKFTPRENMHQVVSNGHVLALTIRGPWLDTWYELRKRDGGLHSVTLTHGRKVINSDAGWSPI